MYLVASSPRTVGWEGVRGLAARRDGSGRQFYLLRTQPRSKLLALQVLEFIFAAGPCQTATVAHRCAVALTDHSSAALHRCALRLRNRSQAHSPRRLRSRRTAT